MALVDVLKYEPGSDLETVWKHPSDQIKLGSQLIIGEGQQAIFVKGGQALDVLDSGTHTIVTGNIPLIEKLVNLPFGGNTPFAAEIWFVNTTVKRDLKWGTPSTIPLMDAAIGFPVNVRAFGKWGFRIIDVRSFVTQIVGSEVEANAAKIREYFIGKIIQSFSSAVSGSIAKGEASVLQINAILSELSDLSSKAICKEFDKFGVELVNFDIESINIPEEDMEKMQAVFAKTLEARELSKVDVGGAFNAIKTFEVLNNAASNESDGSIGAMLGAGVGLGAGFPLGAQMGQRLDVGQKGHSGNSKERLQNLKEMLDEGLITEEQFNVKRNEILGDL